MKDKLLLKVAKDINTGTYAILLLALEANAKRDKSLLKQCHEAIDANDKVHDVIMASVLGRAGGS